MPYFDSGHFDAGYFACEWLSAAGSVLLSMDDYFDCDYFDPTYFDTPDCGGGVEASGGRGGRVRVIRRQRPALPVEDPDELLTLI